MTPALSNKPTAAGGLGKENMDSIRVEHNDNLTVLRTPNFTLFNIFFEAEENRYYCFLERYAVQCGKHVPAFRSDLILLSQ